MYQNYADLHAVGKVAQKLDASANADAVVTVPAKQTEFWVLDWLAWSYSGSPTGGKVTVSIGGTVLFEVDITDDGPGAFHFENAPLYDANETTNQALVVTLAAGGAGVTGKLNIRYR